MAMRVAKMQPVENKALMPPLAGELEIQTMAYNLKLAASISETQTTKFPEFDNARLWQMWPGYQCWDNWPVLDEMGMLANVGGFTVFLALCRPVGASFSTDNRIAYFYSADGVNYKAGGFLFEKPIYDGISEWSGSTILRNDGKLQTFYTVADSVKPEGVFQTRQRLATAIQEFALETSDLTSEDPVYDTLHILPPEHNELLHGASEPDGGLYETPEQASSREAKWPTRHNRTYGSDQTENICDRDPFHFYDVETRKHYLIFEGNTGSKFCPPGMLRSEYIGGSLGKGVAITEDMLKANGCIGIIELTNDDMTYGRRLQPWLVFNLVTDEVERINLIRHDGHLYLFTTCHGNKLSTNTNDDMVNRDLMLGFRADRLGGELTPLNINGVTLQQKSAGAPYQGQAENKQSVYSWLVVREPNMKDGHFRVWSYANWCVAADGSGVQPIMNAGPAVEIEIDGLDTRLVGLSYNVNPIYDGGEIPSQDVQGDDKHSY